MTKQITFFPSFKVKGLTVRTRNAEEQEPATAKIGQLWHDFFSRDLMNSITNREPNTPIYGIYHEYESDEQGMYNVTAGVRLNTLDVPDAETAHEDENNDSLINNDLMTIEIEAGEYMAFETKGTMPQRIIDGWRDVWAYFTEGDSTYQRRFSTDFEQYTNEDSVIIYIAVVKKT